MKHPLALSSQLNLAFFRKNKKQTKEWGNQSEGILRETRFKVVCWYLRVLHWRRHFLDSTTIGESSRDHCFFILEWQTTRCWLRWRIRVLLLLIDANNNKQIGYLLLKNSQLWYCCVVASDECYIFFVFFEIWNNWSITHSTKVPRH